MTNNAYAILKGKYLQILPSKNMQEAISFVLKFLSLLLLWKVVFFVTWRNEGLLNAYNQFSLEVINVILICCSALLEFMGYMFIGTATVCFTTFVKKTIQYAKNR